MRRLLDDHRAGLIEAVDVELGPMPADASPLMRAIAEDMRTRIGLQLAVEDFRPLPYACSEAVNAGLCRYKEQASRAINRLVEAGVVEDAGAMERRGWPRGTRLYRAPVEGL
jgi:hypothetical protein